LLVHKRDHVNQIHYFCKEYVEINKISFRYAYVELRDLTDKGLLTVVGKGRGTKYIRELND